MDYDEACDYDPTYNEVMGQLSKMQIDGIVEDFIAEFGTHNTYAGEDVLVWLGY